MNRLARLALAIAVVSCGALALGPPAGRATGAAPQRSFGDDDWTTFAHDARRSGRQDAPLDIDQTSISYLRERWHVSTGERTRASPLVFGGTVIIASEVGVLRALDASTGRIRWTRRVGKSVAMTPLAAGGRLYIGTHTRPATFSAIDIGTGAIVWQTRVPGIIRSEPIIAGDLIVEGIAGGDPPGCIQGGVIAFDLRTGAERWEWHVTRIDRDGGGVWGPLSYDGRRIYFGTGNTCREQSPTADAIVAIDTSGRLVWAMQGSNPLSDDDFGGGILLSGSDAVATGKNGQVYDLEAATGDIRWKRLLTLADGYGGIGTPTMAGGTLIVSGGSIRDPSKGPADGLLVGLTPGGSERWAVPTPLAVPGAAAVTGNIAFFAIGDELVALDARTGRRLWSARGSARYYASPALVPSGLYAVDIAGRVAAYAPSRP